MNSAIRTDLALEAEALWRETQCADRAPEGVRARSEQRGRFSVTTVEVLDERGEAALGKPRGTYVTVELDALIRREENAFPAACSLLSDTLRSLLPLAPADACLVVGLGNRSITPDAVGPDAVDCVMVTRHLTEQLPEDFFLVLYVIHLITSRLFGCLAKICSAVWRFSFGRLDFECQISRLHH